MKTIVLIGLSILHSSFIPEPDFLTEQRKFERVKVAYHEKEAIILNNLKANNIKSDELNILIIAYKAERQIDVYAKGKTEGAYKKIVSYDICANSGTLGPKRRVGDRQVPEGFYFINRFNPVSNFYLSLGLNYPNQSDIRMSAAKNLGGDVFIHGSCVTIGCMPMTDDKIKEIYLYAIQARQNGQLKIPVYIFPFRMSDSNLDKYKEKYKDNAELIKFWENLKMGYDKFTNKMKELKVSVDNSGTYLF